MSRYFARECALAGGWTGQGISDEGEGACNPMVESAVVDFRDFAELHSDPAPPLVCTTSTCGKFYITASSSDIYTYEIEDRSLRLISKTSCERRVTAVTIDANAGRFVIAALLEGRIGLYIDMLGVSLPVASGPA